ncbi:pollen-specific leucine-rich repeat extensin-like protein 1 [Rana temporaria]|uniref:pollen-specific leucine-rich repeat extensin-like protein 1 n=1 Tax=Rana temporaria TaxID=8407 RepID=UPI001AACF147|nr:pollen-specific leucine-rich repeat extensin-like protein 1 [Rana temporaria]XP_040187329.1 pollen-specific leucine-rich repeat extensin-like protein 1 [Rana temporaria]XP_040191050.1 pollen-specific leucine-rich repeat extensin-like protein 1 [Rana temporaria]XP_040193854.1 pollen-specific leucine-rich repeat extensin-like protein 1 [Rana temporaria]XP_040194660.1 pollen-specific leucine-rich repeat extensin-like protein 1 [Rana temporaria]XP_040200073.1 pollen-specific leucine-rich repeat
MRLVTSNRSGSAACHIKEYIHAKELEFLRPSLSLARTENSWEEAAPTAPVAMDNSSRNSCDETLEGLEPESQLASSSQSTPATPLGELQTTPRPVPRVAARGTKRKAPESDPNVTMMLQIMSEMKDRMGTNTNTPSYGNKSAQCLAELMDRVPKSLQADMLAGTIRYINTFIPPEEPYLSPEPPPPYGPYANQHPQHLSAPTLRHFTAPPFHSHLPQHAPPYPTQTPTLSTHPQLPTPPSAYTSSTLPDPPYLHTHTSTMSPYRRPQTTPSAYHPTTSQTFHLPPQPPTYPSRTTYPSDYTHLPTLPPYNPQPTPTPPPPQPPATPPSRWPHGTTSRSDWSSFGKAIDAGISVDDPGESPSFQKL